MVNSNLGFHRAMSKSELAQKYGIHTETLRRWIINNKDLLNKLNAIGYNKYKNLLNPKELEIIREYLGF